MPPEKKGKAETVVAVCIQEPLEDGSCMDLGAIQGDDLKFLHQAFITDTLNNVLSVNNSDVRLYSIDIPERKRFVSIITDYVASKLKGKKAEAYLTRFSRHEQPHDRWGIRLQAVFDDCFKAGYRNVLVLGSRTPTITSTMISACLKMLKNVDAVFGPTPEGRYYAIGLSKSLGIDLSEFDWKSPSIYNDVSTALDEKELTWSELDIWYAVEGVDELELMARDINQYRFEGDESTARETEIVMERILSKLEQ